MHTRLLAGLQPLLAEQFGVLSREQLRAAGAADATIGRWVAEGLLHRIHPGVYAVGHATLTREARWLAGQLACGPHARVTHWTAAVLLNLKAPFDHRPHITVPPGKSARREGIRVHRSPIPQRDGLEFGPWRTTNWARAIVDCADVARRIEIEELLTAAHDLEIYDHPTLVAVVADARGRRGLKRLIPAMDALGAGTPKLYRSRTERRIEHQLVALGLPRPEANATIPRGDGTYVELDLFFRDAAVNIELDGPHHDLPAQQAKDAARDEWLDARGIAVRRFGVRGLDAERIAAEVRPLLAERAA